MRLVVGAAVVGDSLLAVAATSGLPGLGDEGDTWDDGACQQGEGLTVVLDWSAYEGDGTPDVDREGRILIRCIPLEGNGKTTPFLRHNLVAAATDGYRVSAAS